MILAAIGVLRKLIRSLGSRSFGAITGSTSVAAITDGSLLSRQGYLPWGELRFAEGSLPSRYKFTGQASYESEFGLYYYKARWYDPHLGRFSQPDSMVPVASQGVQAFDRYAYANNNPVRYIDPTGHAVFEGTQGGCSLPIYIINPPPQNPLQLSISNDSPPEPTPITDLIKLFPGSSEDWAKAGTVTDGVVLVMDLYADGVVAYATIVGFGSALPVVVTGNIEVPAVSGCAAFIVADFYLVKPILTIGNYGASAATLMTFVSETKSGATVIEIGQISVATKNSASLSLLGWIAPEAISSTLIQAASFANDLGWISFPFH